MLVPEIEKCQELMSTRLSGMAPMMPKPSSLLAMSILPKGHTRIAEYHNYTTHLLTDDCIISIR